VITVDFAKHLRRFFPTLTRQIFALPNGETYTVAHLVRNLEERFPGLARYIIEDHGGLRKHVNVFIGNELIRDRDALSDALRDGDEVFILQALSGGI
jgi:molybdopterin converting factor small subunit